MANSEQITVTWHRGWTIFMLFCCLAVGAMVLTMAVAAWPDQKILFACTSTLTLMMVAGVRKSIKMYRSPPTMLYADREKVVTHFYNRGYRQQGYEIPWTDIVDLELLKRSSVGALSSRVKKVTIILHLRAGVSAPPEISADRSTDGQTVHLDASTGTLRGERLLAALHQLRPESAPLDTAPADD